MDGADEVWLRFKGMGQGAGQRVSKSLFVEGEEARARDPPMAPFLSERVDVGCHQIATVDEVADSPPGNGEEFGDLGKLDERGYELFVNCGTICNHKVELMGI